MTMRTFFSKKRAEQFAEDLRNQGFEKVMIWNDRDGFGQAIYTVMWM